MEAQNLAMHETMELQGLLTFKTTCLTKTNMLKQFVSDEHLTLVLQSFMDKDRLHVKQIQDFLEKNMIGRSSIEEVTHDDK